MGRILKAGAMLLLCIGGIQVAQANTDDMAVIRERMLASELDAPDMERVEHYRSALRADGSWEDVFYEGQKTTNWEPAQHLRRLERMTQAWFSPASPVHGDEALAEQISTALDYWLKRDPRRRWWWDAIGAPGMLSMIMLMFDERLTDFQKTKGGVNLERAILGSTGQNLVWQAEITARRAVIQRDADLLKQAFDLIASEIKVSDGEGIQADFSFHQHGHVLYNHGYGSGFASYNARLAGMTAGTAFQFPPDKIALLSRYILDGSQWLTHRNRLDFGARGREIAYPGVRSSSYLARAAEDMLELDTGRADEFRALIARVNDAPDAPPLIGNKHFHRSDTMVHHRGSWYASARMYSTRTFNTDGLSGTDDGLLDHYLAEGTTCLLRHGDEYAGLYPVWDWQRIPGTTVELGPHPEGDPKRPGETEFAGGVSDGTLGVAAFHLKRDALSAKKAWFFFSDMVVCLGTDVACDTAHDVVTTVNQSRLKGPVTWRSGGGRETLDVGRVEENVTWVHHDGMGYYFPAATGVELVTEERTESWKRISLQRSDEPVTDRVFQLCIPHGAGPTSGSYAYAVLPDVGVEAMPADAGSAFEIVVNGSAAQAVRHAGDDAIGVVFHEAGKVRAGEWEVAADRACALLISRSDGKWMVSGADPAAGTGELRVTVKRGDAQAKELKLMLPEGLEAGASVSAQL